MYDAGTEIAQDLGKAQDLGAFRGVGADDLRKSHLRVAGEGLGNAQQIVKHADQHDFQDAQTFRRHAVFQHFCRVERDRCLLARYQPSQTDDGYHRGDTRPNYVRSELAYRRVGVIHQHAYERRFDNAYDVGDDEQIHQVARAESVDRAGEQAGGGHLNIFGHQIAVTFKTHGAHAESGDFLVSHFLTFRRFLPIAAHYE